MDRARNTRFDDIKSLGGLALAVATLIVLIVLGHIYKEGCLARGGEYEKCWADGLTIGGMNPGGPLSPGILMGYIIGSWNKEKEKRAMYNKGYWTINPDLRPPTDDPSPPQLR